MDNWKRPAAAGTAGSGLEHQQGRAEGNATPRKWQRVLRWFVNGGTLNRFEAARELRDWCLNTTISQLEGRGLTILRQEETVPGAFGPVHCLRYRIAPESLQRARALLGYPDTPEPGSGSANALERSEAAI